MTFLNTAILGAGLAAVSIPIIIHLLMRRRRTPVMWGAMRFVLEAYRQTRRRLLLERWLLLAVRCLLLAALAVALGRPILRSITAPEARGRSVILLIDDSLTSGVQRGSATALEQHIQDALKLLAALGPGDRAGVITLSSPASGGILPASSDLASVRAFVKNLKPTDARADVPGAMSLAAQQLGAGDARGDDGNAGPTSAAPQPATRFVALYADWLAGGVQADVGLAKLPAGTRLAASLPAPSVDQLGVTSVAPLRQVMVAGDAGGAQTVTITLHRSGPQVDRALATPVSVRLQALNPGGQNARAQTTVNWARGERRASVTLALPIDPAALAGAGVLVGEVTDPALAGDNTWSMPIDTRPLLRVGVIEEREAATFAPDAAALLNPSQWLALALRPSEQQPIQLVSVDPAALDASRLATLDALFVLQPDRVDAQGWTRLAAYARGGGLLAITPPARVSVHTWADGMTKALGLGWTLPREARVLDPAGASGSRGHLAGGNPLPTGDERDLLAALRGELPDLGSSVQVTRVLPPVPAPGATGLGDATVLLTLDDGSPLIVMDRAGAEPAGSAGAPARGAIVYLSVGLALDWSDLPAKPLMVPLMQELVRQGLSRAHPALRAVAGEAPALPAGWAELRSVEGREVYQAGANLVPIRFRGLFRVLDRVGSVRGLLAVNPDARAAQTDSVPLAAVEAWLSSAVPSGADPLVWLQGEGAPESPPTSGLRSPADLLAPRLDGTPSSSWWVGAALLLAVVEVFLARRVSHASLGLGPAGGAEKASGAETGGPRA